MQVDGNLFTRRWESDHSTAHSMHDHAGRHLEGSLLPRRGPAGRSGAGATRCCCRSWDRPIRARSTASAARIRSPARSPSCRGRSEPDCDVDFLFGQVGLDKPQVDTTPNCGNILAGVGPFAIERGLVSATMPCHAGPRAHAQHRHGRRTDGADAGRPCASMAATRASTACPARRRRSPSISSMPPARSAARCCRPATSSTASRAST